MASNKSLKDLSGSWKMNRDLTTDVSPVLEIQGFNILTRKAVSGAPIDLAVTQKGTEEIRIAQSTTASIPAIKEEWYPVDHEWREQKDAFLGKVRSRSRWVRIGELKDGGEGFLTEGLGKEDEVVEAEVESLGGTGWRAVQVWCFEEGRFVRRVVTSGSDGKRAETRLVYDFTG